MALAPYNDALAWLFSVTDYEKMRRVRYNADTFSLGRMRALLVHLGSPERGLRAIHVAGTKGKGSTAAMAAAIAGGAGLRTGLYTSPHLVDLRERIRVGGAMITREDLARLVAEARLIVETIRDAGDPPTFFEILTALAFVHFVRRTVDVAVVEVGLGGRLDATNVLDPEVCAITAVSLDHTFQLGSTLAAIAAEKAGIVKTGVPVVCQPQPQQAMKVIEWTCREREAPLLLIGRDVTFDWRPAGRTGRLTVRTPRATYDDLVLPLMGRHQAVNAATAIALVEEAPTIAARLSAKTVREALAALDWPGRMEVRPDRPEVILDGAHNRASVEALLAALADHVPGRRATVVFACAVDKDVDGMLAALAASDIVETVVFTQTSSPRAAAPENLAARWTGREAHVAATVEEALAKAKAHARGEGLVVVCGSLYLVGEASPKTSASNR